MCQSTCAEAMCTHVWGGGGGTVSLGCTLKRQGSGCRLGVNRYNRPVCDTSNGVIQGFAVAYGLVLSSADMCCSWQALLSQAP